MAGDNSGHPPNETDTQSSRAGDCVEVPAPPDESCTDRETVRLPQTTSRAIQELVDAGDYPNRAAAIRAGIRLLLAEEAGGEWPPSSALDEDRSTEAEPSPDEGSVP